MKNRMVGRVFGMVIVLAAGLSLFFMVISFRPKPLMTSSPGSVQAATQDLGSAVVTALPGLEIISIKPLSEYIIEVRVKNNYDKGITALAATIGMKRLRRTDYSIAELEEHQQLAPGASDIFFYQIPEETEGSWVICSVVFSDFTCEGNMKVVEGILDTRQGKKIQLRRILPHLERLAKLEHVAEEDLWQVREELSKIKQIAESLPIEKDDKSPMSKYLEWGLKDGRGIILKHLTELEEELDTQTYQTSYLTGQAVTTPVSRMDNFRRRFARVKKYLPGLEKRL